MKRQRLSVKIAGCLCLFLFLVFSTSNLWAEQKVINSSVSNKSVCVKQDDVNGSGKYPYNFRLIDNCLAAGGSLFNPVSKLNSDEKVCEYTRFLKSIGITSLMLLHVPLKTDSLTARLEACCK